MTKYKGKKFDPNYKKHKKDVIDNYTKPVTVKSLMAVASVENTREPDFGEKIKPHVGILNEDWGYVNLLNILDDTVSFEFDDAQTIDNDPAVRSYREKLLGSAASQKSSYDFNGVVLPVTEFAKELKNNLNWDDYHRQGYSASKFSNAVIQVLWETVDYEIIGDIIYPKTQRIYGFKHEDYRNYTFNTDKTLGNYGDTIYTPTRTNITREYPYNFIVIRNKPDFVHPEGNSDLKELKPIITLKNFLMLVQARYAKKAAVPSFVAIYKTNKKGDELTLEAQGIANNLSGVENGSGIALPNIDNIVTLLPTAQTDFVKILGYLDSVIQLRILGTLLLGGQSERGGSYASAKVGATELENSIKQVALTLQNIDNIVIKYAIWQRFGTETTLPKLLFDLTEDTPLEDMQFMQNAKIPVDYAAILKRFPVAAGAKEPKDNQWFLGSPDGTLAGLTEMSNIKIKPIENEEERLAKDAQRKQDEEAEKLKKKEL
ncbi:MAG: hypothetical protein L6407_09430 [Candidatus Delongbacteria bacterium]|nr:hypothetical protein [Candidatus Delongbacteria bacterium]